MRWRWAIALLAVLLAQVGLNGQECGEVRAADRHALDEAVGDYEAHRYQQAAAKMRKVAARNQQAAEAQFWLGMVGVDNGFNTAAIRRYFTRCIELCPQYPHPLAHYYAALVLYTDARYEEARGELEQYFALAEGSDDRRVMAVYEEASNYLYWTQFLADAELSTVPFEPMRVKGASSSRDEMMPFLTPDGKELYYMRRMPLRRERTYYAREDEATTWRIVCSTWRDTAFTDGTVLPKPFNGENPEGSVSLTADGRELYYSVIVRGADGYANSDIYRVVRKDGKWGKSENLGQQVNDANAWDSQPSVSADGQTLIFASNRRGGRGGIDLWRCHRLPNGDWSRPENLGASVNTEGNEKMPFLAADGRTLYFLSDGWQGFGGYDIYFADLSDRHGNRPTNLGLPINTEGDEGGFVVTADGQRAFFASKTEGARSSDILCFDLYPAAQPEPMAVRKVRMTGVEVRDTVLVVPTQRTTVVTLDAPGTLPTLLYVRAGRVPSMVGLSDSVVAMPDMGEKAVVEALGKWLVAHPRVHIAIEAPSKGDAQAAYETLRAAGIRAERLEVHYGTDVSQKQIRML